MRSYHLVLLGIGAVVMLLSDVQADTQPEPAPPNLYRPLGASGERKLWTAQDVQMLCEARWRGQARPIQTCVSRNQRKIGRPKMLGDLQELQSIQKNNALRPKPETAATDTKAKPSPDEETPSKSQPESKPRP